VFNSHILPSPLLSQTVVVVPPVETKTQVSAVQEGGIKKKRTPPVPAYIERLERIVQETNANLKQMREEKQRKREEQAKAAETVTQHAPQAEPMEESHEEDEDTQAEASDSEDEEEDEDSEEEEGNPFAAKMSRMF